MTYFFHWLGTPFRAFADFLRALVNLTRAQVLALFSVGMLLGIIALSTQNMVILYYSWQAGSQFPVQVWQMVFSQQFWNNAIMASLVTVLGLVVWGATYVKAKYGNMELEAGEGTLKMDVTPAPQAEIPIDPVKE